MENCNLDLEKICQDKLGWTAQKIARTRPVDMRKAVTDFEEQENVSVVKEEPVVILPETKPPVKNDSAAPNILMFSRKNRPDTAASVPLLTPMPTQNVTVMKPFIVQKPMAQETPSIVNKYDLNKSIDQYAHRHAKLTKQLQEKLDLKTALKSEMDLEESLVLETSIKYTTNRLDRTTIAIMHLKTQIQQSIDRKKKLLAVSTESEDEEENNEHLDESEKQNRKEHVQRVSSILTNIDTLEKTLTRLNV